MQTEVISLLYKQFKYQPESWSQNRIELNLLFSHAASDIRLLEESYM